VPYHRFQEVNKHLREAREWRKAHEPKLQELDTLRGQLTELQTARAEDRAFYRHGLVDEDAQDAARMLYGKVAEADRPEGGIGEWLSSFGEGEGKTAPPRLLAPFLGGSQPAPAEPPARGRPPAPAPVPAPTGKVWSAEAIEALSEQCRTSGDWSAWDAALPDILASQKG
jgi:hypothetical protein